MTSLHVYCGTHGRSLERYRDALARACSRTPRACRTSSASTSAAASATTTATGSDASPSRALAERRRGAGRRRWRAARGRAITLRVEPGRALVARRRRAAHARALGQALGAERRYVGVDTTVANFTSPAVHGAHRRVVAVGARPPARRAAPTSAAAPPTRATSSRDDAPLPEVAVGDLVAVLDAGAYGYCMAGHFLNRPAPAEVFVDGGVARLVTRRETAADSVALEV